MFTYEFLGGGGGGYGSGGGGYPAAGPTTIIVRDGGGKVYLQPIQSLFIQAEAIVAEDMVVAVVSLEAVEWD